MSIVKKKVITKVKLETTLNLLEKASACKSGMRTLMESLPKNYDKDKAINLLHILNSTLN